MTQTVNKEEDPCNLGGGWAAPAPFRTWSSCHRRHRGAPTYKRWHRCGPKTADQPPRKQPQQQRGRGPWFQPPRRPYWARHSNGGPWGGPWCPPLAGFWKPPGRVQVILVYGLYPLCLGRCSCWCGPWNPGWVRPPGRKKHWGPRGHPLRRHPSRSSPRSPPEDLSLCGMRAPPNTTQFIMDQIYEDMRQQEELERQQAAMRAQAGQEGAPQNDAPPSFVHNPSLALSPEPEEENQSSSPQLMEEEEEHDECGEEECDGMEEESQEEEEEEEEEAEAQDEDQVEEVGSVGMGEEEEEMEEEGLPEGEQREEENELPLEIPLSFLVEAEEESENLIKLFLFKPETDHPAVAPEALRRPQDTSFEAPREELRNGMKPT